MGRSSSSDSSAKEKKQVTKKKKSKIFSSASEISFDSDHDPKKKERGRREDTSKSPRREDASKSPRNKPARRDDSSDSSRSKSVTPRTRDGAYAEQPAARRFGFVTPRKPASSSDSSSASDSDSSSSDSDSDSDAPPVKTAKSAIRQTRHDVKSAIRQTRHEARHEAKKNVETRRGSFPASDPKRTSVRRRSRTQSQEPEPRGGPRRRSSSPESPEREKRGGGRSRTPQSQEREKREGERSRTPQSQEREPRGGRRSLEKPTTPRKGEAADTHRRQSSQSTTPRTAEPADVAADGRDASPGGRSDSRDSSKSSGSWSWYGQPSGSAPSGPRKREHWTAGLRPLADMPDSSDGLKGVLEEHRKAMLEIRLAHEELKHSISFEFEKFAHTLQSERAQSAHASHTPPKRSRSPSSSSEEEDNPAVRAPAEEEKQAKPVSEAGLASRVFPARKAKEAAALAGSPVRFGGNTSGHASRTKSAEGFHSVPSRIFDDRSAKKATALSPSSPTTTHGEKQVGTQEEIDRFLERSQMWWERRNEKIDRRRQEKIDKEEEMKNQMIRFTQERYKARPDRPSPIAHVERTFKWYDKRNHERDRKRKDEEEAEISLSSPQSRAKRRPGKTKWKSSSLSPNAHLERMEKWSKYHEFKMEQLRAQEDAKIAELASGANRWHPPRSPKAARSASESSRHSKSLKKKATKSSELYKLAKPLLHEGGFTHEDARRLKRVEYALGLRDVDPRCLPPDFKPLSPHSWKGPETPLLSAVRAAVRQPSGESGAHGFMKALLEADGNVEETDDGGFPLIHLAAHSGNADVCRLLLDHGAKPNSVDRERQTPLFWVEGKAACETLLAAKADPGHVSKVCQTALHTQAQDGNKEVLAVLTQRVTSAIISLRDAKGSTAGDYACNAGIAIDVLEKLTPRNRPLTPDPYQASTPRAAARIRSVTPRPQASPSGPEPSGAQASTPAPSLFRPGPAAEGTGAGLPKAKTKDTIDPTEWPTTTPQKTRTKENLDASAT